MDRRDLAAQGRHEQDHGPPPHHPHLRPGQLLQRDLHEELAGPLPQARRLQAAHQGRQARLRSGRALPVQQHRDVPARRRHREGHGRGLLRAHPQGHLRPGRDDGLRLLRDGLSRREPGHRLQPRLREPLQVAEQPLQARHQGRPGRRRLLHGQGPPPLRPGPPLREARLGQDARADVDGLQGGELRLRVHGRPEPRRQGRRPQRRLRRHQFPARHLRRLGLHRRRDVQLRQRSQSAGEQDRLDPGPREEVRRTDMSKAIRSFVIIFAILAFGVLPALGQAPAALPTLDAARKQAVVEEIADGLQQELHLRRDGPEGRGGPPRQAQGRRFRRDRRRPGLRPSRFGGHPRREQGPAHGLRLQPGRGRGHRPPRGAQRGGGQEGPGAPARRIPARQFRLPQGRAPAREHRLPRLPGFASPADAGPTAVAAMNFLAHCDAVIVDLRQNGGGDPAQIQLISSYFFAEPVHLNDLYARATDTTENYWTLPYVPGAKAAGADLYILTSARTFSGAEEFTYNMKNLKRATVIGETTGGGAHPTTTEIVQRDFLLRVPFARAINPVSKTNWEGTGVAPDIAVPAAEAFDKAYALAVEKLAAKATDPQAKGEFEWILAGEKAKGDPARVDEKILKAYAGVYGERRGHLRERGPLLPADRAEIPAPPHDRDALRPRRARELPDRVHGQGREDRRARRDLRQREPRRLAADEVGAVRPKAAGTPRRPRGRGRPRRRRPRGRRS
ncbi:MAG: S41 family peptidase [Ignavibacteriales bacterium]|nr:S41 family peptidase [Ignavibacteriales bacterium]